MARTSQGRPSVAARVAPLFAAADVVLAALCVVAFAVAVAAGVDHAWTLLAAAVFWAASALFWLRRARRRP